MQWVIGIVVVWALLYAAFVVGYICGKYEDDADCGACEGRD